MNQYTAPVAGLLSHGELDIMARTEWPDYVSTYGLTAEHVPDLIRMVSDVDLNGEDDDESGCAPIHARRALGQLRAVEAVTPLLTAMDDFIDFDDFWTEELSQIFAMIGSPAIPGLVA